MRTVLVVFCALLMFGCGKSVDVVPSVTQPVKPVVTPDFRAHGWVQSVNAEARFVVIRFPLTHVASVGSQLGIYRNGLKVGVAKVTGPERDGNTVADLINGQAQTHDEVREE
jgi:hypothetical protein